MNFEEWPEMIIANANANAYANANATHSKFRIKTTGLGQQNFVIRLRYLPHHFYKGYKICTPPCLVKNYLPNLYFDFFENINFKDLMLT